MVDPNTQKHVEGDDTVPVTETVSDTGSAISSVGDGVHAAIEHITESKDRKTLREKRDVGELDPVDYSLNEIAYLIENGIPLTRNELRNRAVILLRADLYQLGLVDVMYANGESMTIDPDTMQDDEMILFPWDLGD